LFCTKCGAQILDDERFCAKCGSAVKGRVQDGAPAAKQKKAVPVRKAAESAEDIDPNAPLVINITPEKVADMMKRTADDNADAASGRSKKKRKNKGGLWAIALLLVVIVLLVCVGVASNCLNATTPQEILDALSGEINNTQDSDIQWNEDTEHTADSVESQTTSTSTSATTTTTTTTTTTARTSSEQEILAQQAEEIRALLIKNKWETTVSGYDAVITFYNDGTALIEVDVKVGFFTVTQKVEATYEVSSRCFAVIKGSYNGMNLGISGTITKISSRELLVDRGGDLGTLTLKAI